ncbi:D-glycero-beta-D-manno-heptose 1,7-bisphosphate 7-phosphatase [soil metagenome]
MSRLIVLDRDGVINEDSSEFVKSADEWVPIPGSLEAIARLNRAGWEVVVATNQSGIGRGLFDLDAFHAMHEKMHSLLATAGGRISAVFFCPHAPEAGCECRKPAPGLFRQIAGRFGRTTLDGVPVVGDSLRDLVAGAAVGGEPWLVLSGKGSRTFRDEFTALPPTTRVRATLAAVARELA